MLRPEVDWLRCQMCEQCLARLACKLRAIVKIEAGELVYIDLTRCNGCGNCVTSCSHKAIQLHDDSHLCRHPGT